VTSSAIAVPWTMPPPNTVSTPNAVAAILFLPLMLSGFSSSR
jgi:hypothetical protein